MNILIDYLTMSFKIHCVGVIFKQIGISQSNFLDTKAATGYDKTLYYAGVRVSWRYEPIDVIPYGRSKDYICEVCLDCSGKGCRTVEDENDRQFDWFEFLHRWDKLIRNKTVHISRLDLACDDVEAITNMKKVKKYTRKGKFVSRTKQWLVMDGNVESAVYFGAPKSDRRLRIYDKALEQHLDESVKWIRYEFQCRNDNATSVYLNWCNYRDVGKLYGGIMIDFLRFVKGEDDVEEMKENRNQSRLETATWWDKFVSGASRIRQLYLPGSAQTHARLANYVLVQASPSVKAYLITQYGDLGKYLDYLNTLEISTKNKILFHDLGIEFDEDLAF